MKTRLFLKPLVIALALIGTGTALADINIGVSLSATGPAAVLGGHMWDAWAITARVIPVALKKAKPGIAEFRAALRDAIESEKEIAGAHGVFNMSPTDHSGFDGRARVLLQVQNGAFKVISK